MFNLNTFIMKKIKNSCFLLVFALVLIVASCSKNEEVSPSNANTEINDAKRNEATWILGSDNSKGLWAILRFMVGHTEEQCGGKCLMIFGENYHADCRGFGSICERTFKVALSEDTYNELRLVVWDEDEFDDLDFDSFPDRSLYITNPLNSNEQWLNIPEQIIFKDSALLQAIIYNIWFSEDPAFENE